VGDEEEEILNWAETLNPSPTTPDKLKALHTPPCNTFTKTYASTGTSSPKIQCSQGEEELAHLLPLRFWWT